MRVLSACVTLVALAALAASQSIIISPAVLAESMDSVTITWSGLAHPNASDFVAIYLPASNPDLNFIGFVPVTASANWASGSGRVYLSLVNPRAAYQFRVWSAPTPGANKTVVATSPLLTFANNNEPLQAHLALTGVASEMRVQWTTAVAGTPTVRYGRAPGQYTATATGNSSTYSLGDMCGAPANESVNWLDPGQLHNVVLTGLEPGARYFYVLGDPVYGGWSAEATFVASPGAGPSIGVDVIVFGDLGIDVPFTSTLEMQPPALQTIHWITKSAASLVLHIGDLSYARGFAWVWEVYQALIAPFAAAKPVMVCIGNHEYDYIGQSFAPIWSNYGTDSGGECGVPYAARYQMPTPAPPGATAAESFFYSFDYGNVHFTVMSTETNFTFGSPQWLFLQADLAAVDRTLTPFVVFAGHRPLVSSSLGSQGTVMDSEFIENIEPLLIEYDVDLAVAGHVHAYERTFPMRNYTLDESGIVYVVAGMAGNNYQVPWMENDGAVVNGSGHFLEPDWISFRTQSFGYCRLTTNATHLRMRFYTNAQNQVHDDFYLEPKVWRK